MNTITTQLLSRISIAALLIFAAGTSLAAPPVVAPESSKLATVLPPVVIVGHRLDHAQRTRLAQYDRGDRSQPMNGLARRKS